MSKNSKLLSLLALITLFIFACTLPSSEPETNDPNIIFTAAAESASVQLTNIAQKLKTSLFTRPHYSLHLRLHPSLERTRNK